MTPTLPLAPLSVLMKKPLCNTQNAAVGKFGPFRFSIHFFFFLTGSVVAVVFKIGTIIQGQQELWGLFAALKWNAIQMESREQIVFSTARK